MPFALIARLFPGEPHHLVGFQRLVQSHVPDLGKLLDLGCGANTDLAAWRTPAREVWGADFQRHPHLQFPNWFRQLPPSGQLPFPDATFDLVVSMMVLEHVDRPPWFLREVARVLKPGGVFIAHTVNGNHYVTWLRRLLGLLPHEFNQLLVERLYGRPGHDTFPAFYRLNTPASLKRTGQSADLDLIRVDRYEDAGYFRFWGPLVKIAVWADWLLDKMCPGAGRLYLTATWQKRQPNSNFRLPAHLEKMAA